MATEGREKPKKVVVFGLDSADPGVVTKLAAQGRLPAMRKFIENGIFTRLESTMPPHSGPAWTTFSTGRNPGNTGIYCFLTPDRDSYTFRSVFSKDVKDEFFWEIAGRAGVRAGVLNAPITYPPRKTSGFMISGYPDKETSSYPEDFVKTAYPDPVTGFDIGPDFLMLDNMCRYNIHRDVKRAAALPRLVKDHGINLAVAVFEHVDRVQHRYWHTYDESHPAHDSSAPAYVKNIVPSCYELSDRMLGRIMREVGDDAVYIVVSDHGHESASRFFNLYRVLLENRLVVQKQLTEEEQKMNHSYMNTIIDLQKSILYDACPSLLKEVGLNFNIAGREKYGFVTPEKLPELRDATIGMLRDLTDPATGEKVFHTVYGKEDIYSGTRTGLAPDILALSNSLIYTIPLSNDYSTAVSPPPHSVMDSRRNQHTGAHSKYGVFMAMGPGIKKAEPESVTAAMADVAPTILEMFGLPYEGMDGSPLPVFSGSIPILEISRTSDEAHGKEEAARDSEISEEDKKKAIEHLEGMGYL